MKNHKSFLRHEILNLVTLINFLVLDTKLSAKNQEEILKPLKLIGLLNTEEAFILDEKRTFLYQDIELKLIFELLRDILEPQAKKRGVELNFEATSMLIKGDLGVVKSAIEHLILCLLEFSNNILVTAEDQKKLIKIQYKGTDVFYLDDTKLIEYLEKKHSYSEIFSKISTELLKKMGGKISFKKGFIEIKF